MCSSMFKKPKAPQVQEVAPAATDVTASNISDDSGDSEMDKKRKAKRGYAATRLANGSATIAGGAGKQTLG